jgi:hypothetical protein
VSEAIATLVLYKAARTTAHLNENLRLLAANDGDRLTTSYASRWLSRDAQDHPPEAGETALVALALYPYDEFIPCRTVTIRGVALESAYRQYTLEVGPFVEVDAQVQLGDLLARTAPDQRPRQAFLARHGGLVVPVCIAADGEGAWMALASTLGGHTEYTDAVFARLAAVPQGLEVDTPALIEVRTMAARTEPGVRIEARQGELALVRSGPVEGGLEVEVMPRAAGGVNCQIHLSVQGQVCAPLGFETIVVVPPGAAVEMPVTTPVPVDSSEAEPPSTETVVVASAPPSGIAAENVGIRVADLRRLLWDLDRREVDDPGLALAELTVASAPDDAEIAAAAASFFARAERYDEAAACLKRLDPGDLPAQTVYLRFLAACKSGDLADAEELLKRLDFATEDQFAVLKAALASLPDAIAADMGYRLMDSVLDVQRGLDVYQLLRARLRQPTDVLRYAEHLWMSVSEQEGVDLLMEHTTEPAPNRRLLERLLEYASETEGNQQIGAQLISETELRVERGELDRLQELVKMSTRDARPEEHLQIVRIVAAALGASPTQRTNAVQMLCEEADAARSDGRIREAADLASRAAAIAGGDETAEMVAADAVAAAEAALRQTEPLLSLLARDRDARLAALREKLGGSKLRIVGSKPDQDVSAGLKSLLGFKKVQWTASEKHHKTNVEWIDTVDPTNTYVVTLTDAIGHSTSKPLKERCQKRSITHIEATRGLDAIVDRLLEGVPM